MCLKDRIRQEMQQSMKNRDKNRKDALASLLNALTNEEINQRHVLSEAEEGAVVKKEIKQTTETLESAPADRTEIIQECEFRISVLKEFAPTDLTEAQIVQIIEQKLSELNLLNPTKKDKGKIMKVVSTEVKGRADGKLVNALVEKRLCQ